jgi:methylmalonyl-CoA mutase C-terminal domain/subunit
LRDADAADIVLFGGGIIPDDDRAALAELGVTGIFTPGTPTADIIAWLGDAVADRLAED